MRRAALEDLWADLGLLTFLVGLIRSDKFCNVITWWCGRGGVRKVGAGRDDTQKEGLTGHLPALQAERTRTA